MKHTVRMASYTYMVDGQLSHKKRCENICKYLRVFLNTVKLQKNMDSVPAYVEYLKTVFSFLPSHNSRLGMRRLAAVIYISHIST